MENAARKAFAAYGYSDTHLQKAQSGYRNSSFANSDWSANLIIYKNEAGILSRIQRANKVGNFLHDNGYPARSTVDDRILSIKTKESTRYASLYAYLPGTTIPWEGYTKHHIKLLGMAMGRMHTLLNGHIANDTPRVHDEYLAINHRMKEYFAQDGVQRALQTKLNLVLSNVIFNSSAAILAATSKLPNQQTLHMDFVRGNVLFAKAADSELTDGSVSISGILDFEKTAYGHPVFDLARTLAFLLVDCKYKKPDKIQKYFIHSGYAKRGGRSIPLITYHGQDLLEQLTVLFLVYDFYKFLRHNPYESLLQNEHFVRTRDILISRKVLEQL